VIELRFPVSSRESLQGRAKPLQCLQNGERTEIEERDPDMLGVAKTLYGKINGLELFEQALIGHFLI